MPPLDFDLFRQIVESLPVGIYVVALDRRILFWNQAAERITGYFSQEVIGRSCRDDVLVHCGAAGDAHLFQQWLPAELRFARSQAHGSSTIREAQRRTPHSDPRALHPSM